jgi:mannose/fructose-specific phosphotransferase system component IIA
MIYGLVIAHKKVGDALLHALEGIYGGFENLRGLSNEGCSTKELTDKIKETYSLLFEPEVCIFVDVYGGSCWRAAKLAKLPTCHIMSGFNLPMLLSFLNKRAATPFDELPAILETDGKRGILAE